MLEPRTGPNGEAGARTIGALGPLDALSMTTADPESPPTARPRAEPDLPVRHSSEIDPQTLVMLMAQFPVPPDVTSASELPPEPDAAWPAPLFGAPAGPDAISTRAEPDGPPVALPDAGPESPVMQMTDTVAITLTRKMVQLPVLPDEMTAMALPPAPLFDVLLEPPDVAGPLGPAATSVAEPDRPPPEVPMASPELPVMHITVRPARMFTRWMMQLPVRPELTVVEAFPPAPLAAAPGGDPPGMSALFPSAAPPETLDGPGEPAAALASADPTVPGVQLTDNVAAVLVVVRTQLPLIPVVANEDPWPGAPVEVVVLAPPDEVTMAVPCPAAP
ncbi:MAG: hypothetical protein M3256_07530 [Actinomycetota bacterium]|nr:hypothetical protein [Actinomycetota bacterium]